MVRGMKLMSAYEVANHLGKPVSEIQWILARGLMQSPQLVAGTRVWTQEDVRRLEDVYEDLASEDEKIDDDGVGDVHEDEAGTEE